jgi:hypothetical protein
MKKRKLPDKTICKNIELLLLLLLGSIEAEEDFWGIEDVSEDLIWDELAKEKSNGQVDRADIGLDVEEMWRRSRWVVEHVGSICMPWCDLEFCAFDDA